jgi:hypothetical protein
MIVYNYSRKEDCKQVVDSQTVSTVTTTYIGKAKRETYDATLLPSQNYANPIWAIEKRVEDTSTGISIRYRPNKSQKFEFVWADRATITPYI